MLSDEAEGIESKNRSKTISEASDESEASGVTEESDSCLDSGSEQLSMAELELLKKLEEANRFIINYSVCIVNNTSY